MNSLLTTITSFARLVLPLFLTTLLLGCEQELTIQKDPRALTTGDYKVTGVISYTIAGAVSSVPVSGTLSVFASEQDNAFYFLEKISGYNQFGYQITETGSAFSVETAYESTRYQNITYFGKQNGGGKVSLNRIDLERYADTNTTTITSPTGEQVRYTMPIKKHVTLTATRS